MEEKQKSLSINVLQKSFPKMRFNVYLKLNQLFIYLKKKAAKDQRR